MSYEDPNEWDEEDDITDKEYRQHQEDMQELLDQPTYN